MSEQSNQLEATICLINNCPDRDVYELFHRLIDVCCDTNQNNDSISQRVLLWNDRLFVDNYIDSIWPSESSFQTVCNYFIPHLYCFGTRLLNDDADDIMAEKLSLKVKAILQECIESRRKELLKSIVHKTVSVNHCQLVGFDWKVSVVICGDKSSKILEPLTKLDLILQFPPSSSTPPLDDDSNDSETSKPIHHSKNKKTSAISFEFTKNELKQFIQFLQEAKNELAQQFQLVSSGQAASSITTTTATVTSKSSTS